MIKQQYNTLLEKYKLEPLKDVILFGVITILIHFIWRFWANQLHSWPIAGAMHEMLEWLQVVVYDQSLWILRTLIGLDVTSVSNEMIFENGRYIYITGGCSGLKPIMQFVILMLLFRGPWIKKAWFIPLGIIIVHLTNLFRVVGLGLLMNWNVSYSFWTFSHDYLFRPFFYVVIFLLWVWWVEKIAAKERIITVDAKF